MKDTSLNIGPNNIACHIKVDTNKFTLRKKQNIY